LIEKIASSTHTGGRGAGCRAQWRLRPGGGRPRLCSWPLFGAAEAEHRQREAAVDEAAGVVAAVDVDEFQVRHVVAGQEGPFDRTRVAFAGDASTAAGPGTARGCYGGRCRRRRSRSPARGRPRGTSRGARRPAGRPWRTGGRGGGRAARGSPHAGRRGPSPAPTAGSTHSAQPSLSAFRSDVGKSRAAAAPLLARMRLGSGRTRHRNFRATTLMRPDFPRSWSEARTALMPPCGH
jgi:hypothetical protein